MGTTDDHDKAQVLPAGSSFAMSAGSVHSFFADGDTIIQLNSYPKDDPRPKM
ncbi:hypothetical protein [Nitrobacter sp. TKz-YC01]|uniref:hypothetical protein n=1 Tax=Nitrobacter sp. TKz-YC01 TaxID=3398703 RepID=UPI003A0FF2EE